MATLTEQLDAMLGMRANWDGYNADPPHPAVVALAKEFVAHFEAVERDMGVDRELRVYPTRVGGVQFEWEDAKYGRELELDPDGSVSLLHVDKATGVMREKVVRITAPAATASGILPTFNEISAWYAGAA